MGSTHVVVGRLNDVQRIDGPAKLLDFRLLDVRSHALGWNTLLARYAGFLEEPSLTINAVETTPLALAMVNEGFALALVPWPVSRQLVQSLGLVVCTEIPGIAGSGNYYMEQRSGRSSRPAVQALVQALRQAAPSDCIMTLVVDHAPSS